MTSLKTVNSVSRSMHSVHLTHIYISPHGMLAWKPDGCVMNYIDNKKDT